MAVSSRTRCLSVSHFFAAFHLALYCVASTAVRAEAKLAQLLKRKPGSCRRVSKAAT